MTNTVIFMRHAKAKGPQDGQPDFDRALSEAGTRSLAASLPSQLACLDTSIGCVEIWSSPAVRTMQTAELLQKALKKKGVELRGGIVETESLWTQDLGAFLSDVKHCDADAVIAVGHNPFIEDAVASLSGARIPFATGALCACKLYARQNAPESALVMPAADASFEHATSQANAPDFDNETRNRLLWFSQGPISQRWKTLVSLEKTLRNKAEEVEMRKEAFLADPDDIETMHKFRVSIRTLRSLVAFVKPWQDQAQNAAMQADLKAVVGETSRQRELDVLSEHAREGESPSPELIAFCDERALLEREHVMDVIAGKATKKRLDRAIANASNVQWRRRLRDEGLPTRDIRERFDAMAAQLEGDLDALDLADVEGTHDVRKSAKRVRYVAENFKNLIGEDTVGIAKGMTAHQDNLGAICDARVNIDIINGFADEELPEPISWELALLRAKNETFLYTTLRDAR